MTLNIFLKLFSPYWHYVPFSPIDEEQQVQTLARLRSRERGEVADE